MSLEEDRLCNDQGAAGGNGEPLVACIEWNAVTIYRQQVARPRDPLRTQAQTANLTRGRFNGYMSPATRRSFQRTVGTWLRSMQIYRAEVKRKYDPGRAYPTFCTLTLSMPQAHTDREIYRACLMPWLQIMRREYGVEHYVWRAEAQENGNLHYHLILDRFIPKESIQGSWNMCQDNLGYRSRYFSVTGSITPPSTHVLHVTTEVKDERTGKRRSVDPVAYMLGYITDTPKPAPLEPDEPVDPNRPRKLIGTYRKKDGTKGTYITRPITGRVWGMSDALRGIVEPKAEATPALIQVLTQASDQGLLRRVDTERATLFFGPVSVVLARSSPGAWATVKQYYLQVFGRLYPGQLPPQHVAKFPPMDPIGLWIDPGSAALYYPPSHAERYDKWVAANVKDPRLRLRFLKNGNATYSAPEHGYRRARFTRKRQRLGLPPAEDATFTVSTLN